MKTNILVSASIKEEFVYINSHVEKPEYKKIGGRSVVAGRIFGKNVRLLTTGPGLVNTVQALSTSIEHERPTLIIQTGCAGGFKEAGLKIGDIGIATEEIDVQLGIEPENDLLKVVELPFFIIGKDATHYKNKYPFDNDIVKKSKGILNSVLLKKGFSIRTGPFVTVSTITSTNRRSKILFDNYNPIIESMEGSATAHIAQYYNILAMEIRAVSNIVGKRERHLWNLPIAYERSGKAVIAIIKNLNL